MGQLSETPTERDPPGRFFPRKRFEAHLMSRDRGSLAARRHFRGFFGISGCESVHPCPFPKNLFGLFLTFPRWTLRIFFIFFLFWAGEREEASEEVAGGGRFFIKNRGRGGGFPRRRRGRGKGAGGISMGRGGGAKYFFFGAEMPTKFRVISILQGYFWRPSENTL